MDEKIERIRVVTMLTLNERKWLKHLAQKSGRSMASFLRYLLLEEIRLNRKDTK